MESHKGFNLPLLLEVKPSRMLGRSILVLHCLSPAPLLFTNVNTWFVLPVVVILVCHYRYLSKKHLAGTYTLLMQSDGEWLLANGSKSPVPVKLLPGSFVHPVLTVLRFRMERGTTAVILTRDNVHPDQYRRLRVLLRFPP